MPANLDATRSEILANERDLPKICFNGPLGVLSPDGTTAEIDLNGLTVPDAAARLTMLGIFSDQLEALDYVRFLVAEHADWLARRS